MLKLWRKVGSRRSRIGDPGAKASKRENLNKKLEDRLGEVLDEPKKARNELKDILGGLIDKLTKKLGKLPNKIRHWIGGLLDSLGKWLVK